MKIAIRFVPSAVGTTQLHSKDNLLDCAIW